MKPPLPDLRARALKLLARREHSRIELAAKLEPHLEEGDDLAALLDDFERRGWLSDARFAESLAHKRRGRYGSLRITHELREKGVAEAVAGRVIDAVKKDETATAREVWRKKYGTLPASAAERAKQTRFLAGRGFSWEAIEAVLRGKGDD